MSAAPTIRLSNVSRRFETGDALHDVSLTIDGGEFVSIVGPSGCGKSTLLRLIAGLDRATSGQVDAGNDRPAFVFQEPNLLPWRSAAANVRLPLELAAAPRETRQTSVEQSLQLVGLESSDHGKYPAMLSGGMKMRVSLARALVTQPNIMLLDEPFAALDDVLRGRLNEELLAIWAQQQWTGLFVTHNVTEAVFLSQRVLVMSARPGQIVDEIEVPFAYPRAPELRAEAEFAALAGRVAARLREIAA